MSNPVNSANLVGRISREHKVFDNADGSKSVNITLAVPDNYKSGPKQEVQTNLVPMRAYIPAGNGVGSWDRVNVGDQIAVSYALNAKPYVSDGTTIYPLTLEIDGPPTFLESLQVVQERAAKRAERNTSSAAAVPTESDADKLARLKAEDAAEPSAEGPFGS